MGDLGFLGPLLKVLFGFMFIVGLQALGVYLVLKELLLEPTFVSSVNIAIGLFITYFVAGVVIKGLTK